MPSNSTRRILLAEDDENDAELTQIMLAKSDAPLAVDLVRDGEEALDYLHRRRGYAGRPAGEPAVILLDLKMPKVNGLEVLRELKSNGAPDNIRCIPVVVLTSSREIQDVRECYRLGANGYVVKPVDAREFMQTVSHLGSFWGSINEPPPQGEAAGASGQQRPPGTIQ
jgi:CheY-like chemotaxis protein